MIKQYSLRLWVFLICCFFSFGALAQINTPAGAVVPFGANPSYPYGIMPKTLPTSGAYGKSSDAANAYIEWRNSYTESCGGGKYRVKFDDPSKTVSEGIAYGMLLSAYAADKVLFDGLWAYYKANADGQGFLNWKINGCSGVAGSGGATDADLDAAFALMIAKTQWPSGNYGSEAATLIKAIRQFDLDPRNGHVTNGNGWLIYSGTSENCRNPSYQSPAYYREFKALDADNAWDNAVNGGYNLINANAHSTTGLVSDWSNGSGVKNLCNNSGIGTGPTDGYGYDACRNPWRMAQDAIWNNEAKAKSILGKISTYLAGQGAGNVRGPLYQDGGLYAGNVHNATFVSTFAVAAMGTTNQTLLDQMYTETVKTKDNIQNQTLSGYYGNTLRCISLFMMTGNFWKYGTTSAQEINVRQGAINIESGSTFNFQNGQINVGKSLDFTIENLGFATLNLTGTPKVSLTSTDFTVTTQPAAGSLALNNNTVFTIKFNPATVGTKTAVLTISSNDGDEGTYTINLVGTGTLSATAPNLIAKDGNTVLAKNGTFDLGNVTVGAAGTKNIKVVNKGDDALIISASTITGTDASRFSVLTALPMTIAVGDSAYVIVKYSAPATAATASAVLNLTTNDPNYATFTLNLKAAAVACATSAASKVIMDYDGNANATQPWLPKGTFSPAASNPSLTGLNTSATVVSYVRPATGTTTPVWDGKYDIIRYMPCGSSTFSGLSVATPAISILVYSPAVGVQITLAAQTGTTTVGPIYPDYSSNITVSTTKANQWERLTFDFSKIVKNNDVSKFTVLDIQVDPELKYAAGASTAAARTFYIDDIRYSGLPCVTDLPTSQVLLDFDNHNNVSLDYAVASLTAPSPNSVSGGLNTSSNVGKFSKSAAAAAYSDGLRYNGCAGTLDLSSKKIISMLVYSTVADAPIQIAAKIPDGSDADTYPDDAAIAVVRTVFANKWHRLYFDLSAIAATKIPSVFAIDVNFDPENTKGAQTYYFDDIRYESAAPCVAGIPATKVLNDFDDNRYLDILFPGDFNSIYPNPTKTGINASATVGQFVRAAGTKTGTSFRFKACQSNVDLGPGKSIINLMVNSPNAGVTFVMSLKNAAGTDLSSVTAVTTAAAGVWEELSFDHSKILNSTDVAFIDVIVDPNAEFSGEASTASARTYLVDNLRYAPPAPEINIRTQTAIPTDILNGAAFDMGIISVGDSSAAITFSIQNNGLQDLLLNGTPEILVGGANAGDFKVTKSPTFTSTIGALSTTTFTVVFKPTASGSRSASITIKNNDSNESTYVFYLNGKAKAAALTVKQGTILYNATSVAYDFGSSTVNTATAPITFTITSTGDDTLRLTPAPVITVTGTNSSDFIVTQPVITKLHPSTGTVLTTTFTVVFKPTDTGVRNAVINVKNNSSVNPYTFKVTGSTECPTPTAPLAGPDQSICGATATLAGNSPTVGTGAWTIVGTSSATITTPSSPTSTVENLPAGQSVTLRWTISNACGTAFDDVVITRNSTPVVTLPASTSTCTGGSIDLFATVSGGTAPYSYAWTATTGTAPTGATPTVTPTATTTYSLVVTDAKSCSSVAATSTITVNSKPIVTLTPASSDICLGTSAALTVNVTGGTAGYTYGWEASSGTVPTGASATVSPTTTTTYSVTVSDSKGCTSNKATATVNVTPGGAASVSIAPSQTGVICAGTAVKFTATPVNGGVPTYVWSVNGTTVNGVTGAEFTSSTLANNDKVSVKMTSSIACATGSPTTSNTITVAVSSSPVASVTTSAAEICAGGSVNVNAVVNGGVTPYIYDWTSSVGAKPTESGSSLSPTETTSYTVTVTDVNGCKSAVSAVKQVVVNSKPSVTVSPSSTDVCNGQSATLTATVSGGTAPYAYQWTNVSSTSASVTVSPSAETTYSVVVTDSKSCTSASASSVVRVSAGVQPSVVITSSSTKACDFGASIDFSIESSTGGGTTPSYQWLLNDQNVGFNTNTYSGNMKPGYTVKVVMTTNLACASANTATSNIITIVDGGDMCQAPPKRQIDAPAKVMAGETVVIRIVNPAAEGSSTYYWELPAGSTIISSNSDKSEITVKFGSTSGDIYLRESNGAGTTHNFYGIVVEPASVLAVLSNAVSVTPNPGVDFIVTLGDVFTGNVNLVVKNAIGNTVLEESVYKGSSSADYNINLAEFASGIYFLEIITEKGTAVKRIVKQ